MRQRPAARLLVLDKEGRVLLFKFVFQEGALAGKQFWATPGGELGPGETFEEAAKRELFEETGMRIDSTGNYIAEREFLLKLPDGEEVNAQERFFLVQASDPILTSENQTEEERQIMTEHRWWTVQDLRLTPEQIYPIDLARIVESINGIAV